MPFALLALACGASEAPVGEGRRPNVLVYVVDTLRADSLGCYGNSTVETPAVDGLASEGVLFRNAYAHSPWTRPSISSILTGLYPGTHGVEGRESVASERLELLPELFARHGYTTGALITNPNVGSFFGFGQGFAHFEELYSRRDTGLVLPTELVTRSDRLTDRVLSWLDTAKQPFFLFAIAIDPHWPYEPPIEFDLYGGDYRGRLNQLGGRTREISLGPAGRKRVRSFYYGEIAFNDASFGRIVARLKELGIYDETIVVFTSDHGEEFWDHGDRFHARTLYEEILRVPLVIRYPRKIAAGTEVTAVVESVGILPTLLRLAGLPSRPGIDGRDLLDRSADADARAFASLDMGDRQLRSLVQPPWKMIWDPRSGSRRLFNLEIDARESVELDGTVYEPGEAMFAALEEQVRANARRNEEIHRGAEAQRITIDDLPEQSREALEHLGYIEPDSGADDSVD